VDDLLTVFIRKDEGRIIVDVTPILVYIYSRAGLKNLHSIIKYFLA
jgi:hypothetical protein